MADYAVIATVKAMLDITGSGSDARLAALNTVVSRELDAALGLRVGSTFGVVSAESDVARTFYPPGTGDTLLLTPGVRSITSITQDGRALTAGTDYRLVGAAGPFWLGLYRLPTGLTGWQAVNRSEDEGTAWYGTVVVTGQWADQGGTALDPLLVEAANVLVAGYYRKDHASDGEVSGPEGLTFRPGNPWNDPRIKTLLTAYGRDRGAA